MGHIVDELRLHLVELALVGEGSQRDDEHRGDDEYQEEAHIDKDARVALKE